MKRWAQAHLLEYSAVTENSVKSEKLYKSRKPHKTWNTQKDFLMFLKSTVQAM